MKIVFRVDSSNLIGAGHTIRCLVIAEEMKDRGIETYFICKSNLLPLKKQITSSGHEIFEISSPKLSNLDWKKDAEETLKVIKSISPEMLIVDHYSLEKRWQKSVKEKLGKLIVIDDLPGRKLFCDILIDQNLGRKSEHYLPYIEGNPKLLMGTEFALVREEFSINRKMTLQKRKRFDGINNILISLGGVGTIDSYSRILETLSNVKWKNLPEIDITLGFTKQEKLVLENFCKKNKLLKVNFHSNSMDIYKKMIKADLCIGYAGSSSWERCVLGLPSFVKAVSDNQLFIAKNLEARGAVKIWEKEKEIKKLFETLVSKKQWFKLMESSKKICDGKGSRRVVDAILE